MYVTYEDIIKCYIKYDSLLPCIDLLKEYDKKNIILLKTLKNNTY